MPLTTRKKRTIAQIALLLTGFVWGMGFVVMKNTLDLLPVNILLAIRFFLAGAVLFLVFFRRMIKITRKTLLGGMLAGLAISIGFYTQTVGLTMTTAGNNAFLTATYMVMVPFFQWAHTKKRPGARSVIAGVLCLSGVGFIALNENLSMNAGDAWTLACGLAYAVHIVIVSSLTQKGHNAFELTCVQFLTSAALFALMGAATETMPARAILFSRDTLLSMLFLVGLCTLFGMVVQNVALNYTSAAHASLLMGTEAPFGCLLGILVLHEPFTARFFFGALLIAGAIVISELGGKRGTENERMASFAEKEKNHQNHHITTTTNKREDMSL